MNCNNCLDQVSSLRENYILTVENNTLIEKSYKSLAVYWKMKMWKLINKNDDLTHGLTEALKLIESSFSSVMDDYSVSRDENSLVAASFCIQGVFRMKATFLKNKDLERAELVNELIDRLRNCYSSVQNLTINIDIKSHLQQIRALESSVIEIDKNKQGCTRREALVYLHRKLELFLLTRSHTLSLPQVEIVKAIRDEFARNLLSRFTYSRTAFVVEEKDEVSLANIITNTFDRLDRLKGVAASIGIFRPVGQIAYDIEKDGKGNEIFSYGGHQASLGCRKEEGGYVITMCNAGGGGTGEVSKINNDEGKTVVEFSPLDRIKAEKQFFKSLKIYHQRMERAEAEKTFAGSLDALNPVEVQGLPDRPFQRIPNCGIRNHIEWIIYTLQRLGEIALANEIVFFQVIQDETAHPKPKVQPLFNVHV